MTPDPHAALMTEGDRLARHLTQTLHVTAHDPARLTLLGRSLALNLTRAFSRRWNTSPATPGTPSTPS